MKSMNEFYNFKRDFINRHNGLLKVITSSMNEYGCYSKTYLCADNSILYECNGPVFLEVSTVYNVNGVIIPTNKKEKKKFFQSEVFSSENAKSEYYIEAWN